MYRIPQTQTPDGSSQTGTSRRRMENHQQQQRLQQHQQLLSAHGDFGEPSPSSPSYLTRAHSQQQEGSGGGGPQLQYPPYPQHNHQFDQAQQLLGSYESYHQQIAPVDFSSFLLPTEPTIQLEQNQKVNHAPSASPPTMRIDDSFINTANTTRTLSTTSSSISAAPATTTSLGGASWGVPATVFDHATFSPQPCSDHPRQRQCPPLSSSRSPEPWSASVSASLVDSGIQRATHSASPATSHNGHDMSLWDPTLLGMGMPVSPVPPLAALPSHGSVTSASHTTQFQPLADVSDHSQKNTDTPSVSAASASTPGSSSVVGRQEDWAPDDIYDIGLQDESGNWRCRHAGCASTRLFQRVCDLRKHYRSHTKNHFCNVEGCRRYFLGFSSQKDCRRHKRSHNPNIDCLAEGCGRKFSRVDNMRKHYETIHMRSQNTISPRRCRRKGSVGQEPDLLGDGEPEAKGEEADGINDEKVG